MFNQATLPGIPTREEEELANFRLDTEGSFAHLVITPIHAISDDGETDYIHAETSIEIKPYPNPYGFGGVWGNGGYPPEDEAKVIAEFHHWADPWLERGLTRLEIKHAPARTEHVPTEAQRQAAIAKYSAGRAGKRNVGHQVNKGQTALF